MLQSKNQNRLGALGQTLAKPGISLAVALSLLFGAAFIRNASARSGQGESLETLSGTWKTTVTLTNCQTGAPLPIPPFPALNTFETNGTMLETGARSLFRSPGHGTWERTGHNEFRKHWIFFRFAPDGSYIGTQEITGSVRLTSPDAFTADGAVTLRDADGNVVGSGCATETGTRF
jgi:hypothetical protein